MFTHLSDLFDGAPAEDTTNKNASTNSSNVYLAPMNGQEEEEPMEEIDFEVTPDGVIEPPPPGGLASYPMGTRDASTAACLSVASSGAVRVDDNAKPKRTFGLFKSRKKQAADDISEISDGESFNSAAPAAAVRSAGDAQDNDDGDSAGAVNTSGFVKVVGVAPVPEKAPAPAYRYKPERKKKTWLICVAAFLLLVAIVVPIAVIVPRNKSRSSAAAGAPDGSSPTAAPTAAALPEECEVVYDNLDNCLLTEVSQDQADACIDCVWSFLPENTGPCDVLEAEVCNILDQCDCLTCTDELEGYLDCQSECDIGCGF